MKRGTVKALAACSMATMMLLGGPLIAHMNVNNMTAFDAGAAANVTAAKIEVAEMPMVYGFVATRPPMDTLAGPPTNPLAGGQRLTMAGLFGPTTVHASEQHDITVTVDGERVVFADQQPFIQDGRMLVPVRGVFEHMGWSVDWDGYARAVTLERDGNTIVIPIGENVILINGVPSEPLDVPAQITEGGRTMLPLRAVAEATGATVDWDGNTRTVVITTGVGVAADPPPPPTAFDPNDAWWAQRHPDAAPGWEPPEVVRMTQEEMELARWVQDHEFWDDNDPRFRDPRFIEAAEILRLRYIPWLRQEEIRLLGERMVAAGLPREAMVCLDTGFGSVQVLGTTLHLGEFRSDVETRIGAATSRGGNASQTLHQYEVGGGRVNLTYSQSGRLVRIAVRVPGFSYGGRAVGDAFSQDLMLRMESGGLALVASGIFSLECILRT